MNIFADIAKNMEPGKLKILANYRAEAKFFRWLPTGDELNILPSGFLIRAIHDGEAVAQLNPYGMRVAMAAEKLAIEAMTPEEKRADMQRRLAEIGLGSSFDGGLLTVTVESA